MSTSQKFGRRRKLRCEVCWSPKTSRSELIETQISRRGLLGSRVTGSREGRTHGLGAGGGIRHAFDDDPLVEESVVGGRIEHLRERHEEEGRGQRGVRFGDMVSRAEPPQKKRRSGSRSPEYMNATTSLVSGRTIGGYVGECTRMSEQSCGQENRLPKVATFFATCPSRPWQSFQNKKEKSNYLFHPS